MQTMTPIDANKCEFYTDKRPDIPHSWKPSKMLHKRNFNKLGTNVPAQPTVPKMPVKEKN